ncbi:cobyric acid synthase [Hydrogenophaga intermedia]|uniref:cobyric acid synthase n=1 Tax=Hydrogenophaga intermedia TaxID=65786 RepID=UPI0020435E3B|nr:cobyric acid synthase [Hydrogenophaga intermedia]MCM3566035.1 cobyric acid synthase [Hydrogenophaga intermedia]
MVWGTSSGAGKSLLATALCRWAAQRGIDVAPFKAQNMSNNARVVPGLAQHDETYAKIGAAQYFQAIAARVTPSVDMNPVLLKPERDTASQVVLHGQVAPHLAKLPWRERSVHLAEAARESFVRLSAQHELLVMEGAGSPAEINLAAHDYVNLGAARWARAAGEFSALLVADIDRGGAFAHLFGTWTLLADDLKPTLVGFVLNKFRGDAQLLAPGAQQMQALSGVPVVGVLPMQQDHGLPEEDGVFDDRPTGHPQKGRLRVAIVAYPRISNIDEFQPLRQVPGLQVGWVRQPSELAAADWIILPGSKQVSGDLQWLRERGLDVAIARHAAAGRKILGVCGGLQMLGQSLDDPAGVDGAVGSMPGLGLLPLSTRYELPKRVLQVQARFATLAAPWQSLGGVQAHAYEIRTGVTRLQDSAVDCAACTVALRDHRGDAIGWQCGPVLGVYAHGLFEEASVVRALFGVRTRTLDASLDRLADFVDRHMQRHVLERMLRP